MARILIVEDEPNMRRILSTILRESGHDVLEGRGLKEARETLARTELDLVMTDQKMPGGDGLAVLSACRAIDPTLPVVFLTAFATIELAVTAMRQGAFDFIAKPFLPEPIRAVVERACAHTAVVRENERLRTEASRRSARHLLGASLALSHVKELIARAGPTNATVLVTGETGTGKELVARALHEASPRAERPFVAVNCAALAETLLESELFGHERGAFTGADRARQGVFEAAQGGTLFLDEAGEMSLGLQAKLLRVLMGGEVVRVGSTLVRRVDVRLVVATHHDLSRRVREGSFREDLYYRIAVLPIALPPLRERAGDLPLLVESLRHQVAMDLKVRAPSFTPEALELLARYPFPGNVRELRNLIERAAILHPGGSVGPEAFRELAIPSAPREAATDLLLEAAAPLLQETGLRGALEAVEKRLVRDALRRCGGRQAQAARRLGLSRADLAYKVRKYDLGAETSAQGGARTPEPFDDPSS